MGIEKEKLSEQKILAKYWKLDGFTWSDPDQHVRVILALYTTREASKEFGVLPLGKVELRVEKDKLQDFIGTKNFKQVAYEYAMTTEEFAEAKPVLEKETLEITK